MQARRVPDSVLAAAMSGCVVEPDKLNSERIAERFGNYDIEIVDINDGMRRSSLYSGDGDARICRTFAVVRIDTLPTGMIDTEHDLVMRGGSIGAIFKAHGWAVYKETAHAGMLKVPYGSRTIPALMHLEPASDLAVHVYRLLIRRGGDTFRYATVVEVHHPDYLGLEDIERAYVVDAPAPVAADEFRELTELVLRDA